MLGVPRLAQATRCASTRRQLTASPVLIARSKCTRLLVQHQPSHARSPSFLTFLIASRSTSATGFRRTCSSMSKPSEAEAAASSDKLSHLERLKDLWRKYGVVATGTYFSLYGTVLGSIYLAIDQGWVHTDTGRNAKSDGAQSGESFDLVSTTNKFVKWAEDLGIAQYLDVERVNAKTGSFLLAWIATKFTEPLRLALTVAATPRIARFLGRAPKLPLKPTGKLASLVQKQQALKKEQLPKA